MKTRCILLVYLFVGNLLMAQSLDKNEPIKYIGENNTSNSDYLNGYHDGQMKPAIGVQNYQVMRANRSYPDKSDGLGWTYNHAPNLAYWNNRFYFHYLSNVVGEHITPGATLLSTSVDGKNWEKSRLLFPVYFTSDSNANIHYHYMHQRMGFYVAPDGRLLTMGFYGDPYGDGIGRVVREIYENNKLGPVYFIKMNKTWKGEVKYPFYTESPDSGFVQACNSFLDDKVRRMQWWEENRYTDNADGFFRVPMLEYSEGKRPAQAFCFYTLPDSTIVGFFKARWITTSSDKGDTWSAPVQCNTLTYGGAKIWAQRLDNGQYALVYNPTNSMARHPLSIATSDDGIHYDNLLNIHSEVPPKRYWGMEKRPGAQYVRGIAEGNGNPPGDDLWVVYSVNKEDMWISKVPVPLRGEVNGPIFDNFNEMEAGGEVIDWNIYSPLWCPVEITNLPGSTEKVLMLKDFDPYDYAKAVRVFQPSKEVTIQFRLYIESNPEVLAIEVVAANGTRCVQLELDTKGNLLAKQGNDTPEKVASLETGVWKLVEMHINTDKKQYKILVDKKEVGSKLRFAADGKPERIIFRTGRYRLTDDVQKFISGDKFTPGQDKPGSDEVAPEAVYYIKDFRVSN